MSTIKLLILPKVIFDRMPIHSNTDEKLIVPEIKAAQDMYIRPLLGSVLFDKILDDISNDALVGDYKDLMDNFLLDAMCNYTMSGLPETLNYQYWNKGVATKTTDDSQNPSMSDMFAIVNRYKKRAEHYANACRLHIRANLENFPEYYAPGGIDKVSPDVASFTSPIYLGGRGEEIPLRANRNPNFNSNDPYIEY